MTSRMAGRILLIVLLLAPLAAHAGSKDKDKDKNKFPYLEATVAQLQAEMATGRLAFGGGTTAVVFEAILNRSPLSPARLNPELIPDISDRFDDDGCGRGEGWLSSGGVLVGGIAGSGEGDGGETRGAGLGK